MKKTVATALCFALSMLLIGCGKAPIAASSESSNTDKAIKWFDSLSGDEMIWDGVREYDLDAFPGVTFRWSPLQLEAVTDEGIVTLYTGMPIWSVYFYDLTGDGKPELCSSLSYGSGIVDDRIIVYDYEAGASYELSDRFHFDYVLRMQEDSLVVEKREAMQGEIVETGELVFINDTIQLKEK